MQDQPLRSIILSAHVQLMLSHLSLAHEYTLISTPDQAHVYTFIKQGRTESMASIQQTLIQNKYCD